MRKDALPTDASGFVVLADFVPHVIQEIRYHSTYNFIGERIDGYEEPVALLTIEAARALKAVSNELFVQGYRLKVFDAYRPVCAVRQFILWGIEDTDIRMKPYFYPDLEKQELFAKGYIAKQSSHSRGSAIDLTLLDMKTGRESTWEAPSICSARYRIRTLTASPRSSLKTAWCFAAPWCETDSCRSIANGGTLFSWTSRTRIRILPSRFQPPI